MSIGDAGGQSAKTEDERWNGGGGAHGHIPALRVLEHAADPLVGLEQALFAARLILDSSSNCTRHAQQQHARVDAPD